MEQNTHFTWEQIPDPAGIPWGIRILSADPEDVFPVIPEELEGLPVLELGAYALENSVLREIRLPSALKKIGRYAFYNCGQLERIHVCDSLKDIGTGAFTGVHRVREIHLRTDNPEGKQPLLQELLSNFSETIRVVLEVPKGEICLLFPEYYEQGVENTPARIVVNQFFGTGMKYRNCFQNRTLQFEEYDSLFPLAAAEESMDLVLDLALLRLQYPCRLQEKYRKQYLDWIRDHGEEVLEQLIRQKRLEEIRLILEETELPQAVRNRAAISCSEQGFAAAVPLLMQGAENSIMPSDSLQPREQEEEPHRFPEILSSFDLDEI